MKTPKIDVSLAWRRLNKMMAPVTKAQKAQWNGLAIACVITWPAMAIFGKYILEMDDLEHHARAEIVNKKMPYMNNPGNVVYGWNTPCTLFDFDCAYNNRNKH